MKPTHPAARPRLFVRKTPILVLIAFMVPFTGCIQKNVTQEFLLQEIGGFDATAPTNNFDENFCIPPGYGNSLFGLSVRASDQQLRFNQEQFLRTVAALKFTLELFRHGDSNRLYHTEVLVQSNCVYYSLWKPDLGYLLTGIDPLPYASSDSRQAVVPRWSEATNRFAIINGTLSPGNYRVRISVDIPVTITNRFRFWLYSYEQSN